MSIFGVGTDIVQIARIKKAVLKHGDLFAERILSAEEQIQYASLNPHQQVHYLAKRFAGKEAVAKALGTGISKGVEFKQISITNNPAGQPIVSYLGVAQALVSQYQITQTHISLADERDFAVAFVTLTC